MKILIIVQIGTLLLILIQAIQISKLEKRIKYLLFEKAYEDFFGKLQAKREEVKNAKRGEQK